MMEIVKSACAVMAVIAAAVAIMFALVPVASLLARWIELWRV